MYGMGMPETDRLISTWGTEMDNRPLTRSVFVLLENDDYDHSYNVVNAVYETLASAVSACNAMNALDDPWLTYHVREMTVN
jgi:hypothetical protein